MSDTSELTIRVNAAAMLEKKKKKAHSVIGLSALRRSS